MLKVIWTCKPQVWLPGYLKRVRREPLSGLGESKPIDVMVVMVDHFEPARRDGELGVRKVQQWCEKYKEVATHHRDSDGRMPQHTWFYRYDYPNFEIVSILSRYVYEGLGEIEFHLHHGYDTPDSFRDRIQAGVKWFNQAGAMISAEESPRETFGYIAGNWSLANGRRDPKYGGVNTEIGILKELGCYADFTFPAVGTIAQPRKVNAIYYASSRPEPKSYDAGVDVEVGKTPSGDLMIIQGPIYVDWRAHHVETAAIEKFERYVPRRIAYWQRAHIHVTGRPEWVFIKLHTHGMQSREELLGHDLNALCSGLEDQFKNFPYRLHYVTAREAYNIIKAAEAGENGNPNNFRDYGVREPVNRKIHCNHPFQLKRYSPVEVHCEFPNSGSDTRIDFAETPVKALRGDHLTSVRMKYSKDMLSYLEILGAGEGSLELRNGDPNKVLGTEIFKLPFVFAPSNLQSF